MSMFIGIILFVAVMVTFRGMMISGADVSAFNGMTPTAQKYGLGTSILQAMTGFQIRTNDDIIYVNAAVAADGDGKSWNTAFKTIQSGLNKARYQPGTTTVEGDDGNNKDRRKFVFVWPGHYNERVLFSGYNISLCGVTPPSMNNGDWGGVVLNYDGAQDTTCVLGFTGAGIEIANLFINNAEAIPSLFVPTPGDGCWVHDNIINGDGTNATYGIQWLDCRNSTIERNRIGGHATAEIAVGNGGATFFRNSTIRHNIIASDATSGIIVVAATICGADDGSEIFQNRIIGTATTGIHQDSAGAYVLVADNWIQAGTAVTDDGTGACDNHTAS